MKPLRIGFLSTARIGRKNWKAIHSTGNCLVTAVASRDGDKSRQFIEECQRERPFAAAPEALDSYEALMASPAVDAVYVPLPTALRKDWVIRAAQNGKHILCEKPCAVSAADLADMLAACRRNRVQFLDGVMFMHNPRLAKVREALDDGRSIGPVRRITAAFTFNQGAAFFQTNIRADARLEPAGCVGDLGWYCLRFALWVLHWQLPESVRARVLSPSDPRPDAPATPAEFAATLFYPGGLTVDFYNSFRAGRQNWVHVSGELGWLRLPDFVHPLDNYEPAFEVNEKIITVPGEMKCPPGANPQMNGHATAHDTRMWRNFAHQIATGQLNEAWFLWAEKTQAVMDACLAAAK